VRRGGRFSVALLASAQERQANGVRDQLREAGYAAEVVGGKDGEKPRFTVRIRQLPTREEAQALADRLKGQFGISAPTVSQ